MIGYRIFTSSLPAEWDSFVDSHPEGRCAHLAGIGTVLKECYGISSSYIALHEDNALRGVFPCVVISQFTGRKKLVSMPYVDFGGFLLANDFVAPPGLIERALSECISKSGADFLLIRGPSHFGGNLDESLFQVVKDCHYATLPLAELCDVVCRYDRRARQNMKQAHAHGLSVTVPDSGDFLVKHFYPLYSKTMTEFGTPPHSLDFFLAMRDALGERLRIFAVMHNSTLISALVTAGSSSRLHLCFFVSRKDARGMRPNELLMSEMIAWACEHRYAAIDMGTIRHEGQRRFKMKWGARLEEYNYYFYPRDIDPSLVKTYGNPDLLNKIWARCIPEPLSRRLGPLVRRKIGR